MARYALSRHTLESPTGARDHFDLFLERQGVLISWRLPGPPWCQMFTVAERSFDHRLVYLEFSGKLSGDRGRIERLASGPMRWLSLSNGLIEIELVHQLHGYRLTFRQIADTTWGLQTVLLGRSIWFR